MKTEQPESQERLFYSADEMAAMCGVVRGTWNAWTRKNIVPQPIIVDGARKWPADAIDTWEKELNKMSKRAQRLSRNKQKREERLK
jgi:predicted DNA-binding transcriptional regulator AlpA